FCLAVGSMRDDSAIMDEVAHTPAGYSYLTQKDARLNPEHPPLIKDLSAIPLLFMDLNFPSEHKAWQEDVNGQWSFGFYFLYQSGNDADQILFWSRIPMILLMLLLGFYIFKWTRELFGRSVALLVLFLYSLSPTIITHGRFVTTDLAVAAGIFIATYYFIKYLQNPSKKNLLLAGIVFGLALLTKFSAFLLVPFFFFLIIVWLILKGKKEWLRNSWRYLRGFILIGLISLAIIGPVYQYHVLNYPPERQVRDTESLLSSHGQRWLVETIIWMADKPILRAYAQYFLGLAMVIQRAAGGNTTYFFGEVSAEGWWYYFPLVYLIKVPLAMHFLTLVALLFVVWQIKKPFWRKPGRRLLSWSKNHFSEMAMLAFIILYWAVSIRSTLNIGVRHVLPTFPFIYILVSGQISQIGNYLKNKSRKLLMAGYGVLAVCLFWYLAANLLVYPHYLAYFNETTGGPKEGYKYAVDSNLDWGQDLKRLAQWVDEKGIDKIKVDYFGGAVPGYYLKDKFTPLLREEGPQKGWIAVSATLYQTSREKPETSYQWLDQYEPVIKIGHSILVYHLQ
ncbi:MAG TPA: glycosyltransferase family 39 protein, partial [Candidatus Portnoybacteria bacterium]|nr:glycosyltransferase family 39 protein [Candidatus Portnoybacteria bacterium]